MQLELEQHEVDYLKQMLTAALVELRNEVSNTDTPSYREQLKADEEVLRALILRLGGTLPNIESAVA